MTTSDKLREFWQKVMREYGRWWGIEEKDTDKFLSDLTALVSEHYVSKDEHEAIAKMAEALKADMNAAKLELALMRKFILWTGENCQYYPDTNEWMYFESPMTQKYFKGTDELFAYWKDNEC